jgi:pimeloyl-ACP methyl ester carboxylesterase
MPQAFINGVNICYNIDGSGEPLFLIQGLTGGRNDWFFQMRAFKKHYKVVTFDNRGAGSTDKRDESYDIRTMADDTIGLMDHLKVDRAHILGMSLGSLIAQEIAINYPDRIMKLILVAAIVYGEGMREITEGMREALGLRENYSEEEARNVMNNIDFMEYFTKVTGLSFNKKLVRVMIIPLSKIHAKRIGREGLMGQLHAASTCDTLDKIQTIKAPTLVLTGTEDKVVSPHSSEVIADRIPNAKLVTVEGGSHAFYFEKPRRFNREVLDFLRDG